MLLLPIPAMRQVRNAGHPQPLAEVLVLGAPSATPPERFRAGVDRNVAAQGGEISIKQGVVVLPATAFPGRVAAPLTVTSHGPSTGIDARCPYRDRTAAEPLAPQRGRPGMPSALSPVSASRSGMEAGGTPYLATTAASSRVSPLRRSRQTTRFPSTSWARSLSGEQMTTRSTPGSPAKLLRRGGDGVVRLEFNHRPHADTEGGDGAFGQRELRQ